MDKIKEYLGVIGLPQDQQEAILSLVEAYGSEMLHEYPPVYNSSGASVTSKELEYLDDLTKGVKEQIKRWDDSFDIGL